MGLHLLIPHASAASEAGVAALATLEWPNLTRLLARLCATERTLGDEYTLSMPHEQVLARLQGWQGEDGRWPLAAWSAQQDGCLAVDPGPEGGATGWGLLTPCHWHVGSDQVTLIDPAALELDADESRALLDAVRPSFEAEGWSMHWGAALRWYVSHPLLAELKTASPDRAIGRNLDIWLRGNDPQARRLRRLQVEAQMLWHDHPVNTAREAQRALTVNSFWLSGCGRPQPSRLPLALANPAPSDTATAAGSAVPLQIETRLRAAMLASDWAEWCAVWRALDAGPIAELLARVRRGEAITLTLCGERHAQRYETRSSSWLNGLRSRWQTPSVGALLGAL